MIHEDPKCELEMADFRAIDGDSLNLLNDDTSDHLDVVVDDREIFDNRRKLNFIDGVGIIVGIIIGSGIFSSPGVALERSGSPGASLFAWAAAGLLVCLTSQCYFELGCMMPSAGGDYDYLQKAYGDRVAFSFAWFNFFISKPGSQAIIATIFGRYCETVYSGKTTFGENDQTGESTMVKAMAASLLTTITLINCLGIKESSVLQNALTSLKIALVLAVFVIACFFSFHHPAQSAANMSPENSFRGSNGIFSFGSAMIACLWSYDGWCDLNFLMEDLSNPEKTLPRVVLSSLAIVTISYLLANIAYFSVLSQSEVGAHVCSCHILRFVLSVGLIADHDFSSHCF